MKSGGYIIQHNSNISLFFKPLPKSSCLQVAPSNHYFKVMLKWAGFLKTLQTITKLENKATEATNCHNLLGLLKCHIM